MRLIYSLAMYLATPFVLIYFGLRGFRDPRYRARWGERLGFAFARRAGDGVLIHAASVGEVNAASPVVSALLERRPDVAVTVTSFTPTGSQRVRELFGDRVAHQYLPLDLPDAVRRFLDHLDPALLVIMETEIWPNLYAAALERNLPIMLANARLSEASKSGYRRASALVRPAFAATDAVLAQTEDDAARFVECGAVAERVSVAGNLKFDVAVPAMVAETGDLLKTAWGVNRPVLVAGSTHEGDEAELLAAFNTLLRSQPDALLVLAPRHPERFARTAGDARDLGLDVYLRSEIRVPPPECQCLVVDAMGELQGYYAAADVTFVGGTIEPLGGHNLLEPAALGKPLLIGPHTDNVAEIAAQLLAAGAALRVNDRLEIADAALRLLTDPAARDRMGQAAFRLVESGRGALKRTLAEIERWLPRPSPESR